MARNLFFNTCRESSDHGAFNSWSRMPYATTLRNGTLSAIPAYIVATRNFIVANYAADGGCLDNDDGSAWYQIHHNFCVYGGHKSDFDGHSKQSFGNLHVYPQVYGPRCFAILQAFPAPGFAEEYFNNTCILANAGENVVTVPRVGNLKPADFAQRILLANNTVYVPGGSAPGPQGFANYSAFVEAGFDAGTVLRADMPDGKTIAEWGAALVFE
jgi:hypothetical protein